MWVSITLAKMDRFSIYLRSSAKILIVALLAPTLTTRLSLVSCVRVCVFSAITHRLAINVFLLTLSSLMASVLLLVTCLTRSGIQQPKLVN